MSVENMQLNISNKRTYQLAQQLSELTGESMTRAVTRAIEAQLKQLQTQQRSTTSNRLAAVMDIARTNAELPLLDTRDPDTILYDADGLPRDA